MLNVVSLLIPPLFVWLMMEVLLGDPTTFSIEEVSFHQVINFIGNQSGLLMLSEVEVGTVKDLDGKFLNKFLFCFVLLL